MVLEGMGDEVLRALFETLPLEITVIDANDAALSAGVATGARVVRGRAALVCAAARGR